MTLILWAVVFLSCAWASSVTTAPTLDVTVAPANVTLGRPAYRDIIENLTRPYVNHAYPELPHEWWEAAVCAGAKLLLATRVTAQDATRWFPDNDGNRPLTVESEFLKYSSSGVRCLGVGLVRGKRRRRWRYRLVGKLAVLCLNIGRIMREQVITRH
jgi:hypothetical protein